MEPKGFRDGELKGSWKSMARIAGLTVGVAVILVCVGVWLDLASEAAQGVLIAAGGIVLVLGVTWGLFHVMRVTVRITDRAIVWGLSDSVTAYRFAAIDHCEIAQALVGGKATLLLVVSLKNGDRETFGVAPPITAEVLRSALEQRGVNVVTGTAIGLGEQGGW